jgi:hypothetical protein
MHAKTNERTNSRWNKADIFPPKTQLHFELCIFSLTGNSIRDRKKKEGKNYDTWKVGKHSKMLKKAETISLHYVNYIWYWVTGILVIV